jgi:hypothetical protein
MYERENGEKRPELYNKIYLSSREKSGKLKYLFGCKFSKK